MSVPVRELVQVFTEKNRLLKVYAEAAGSRTCARKITDLHRSCDVFISADLAVIETLLMPEHTDWAIVFAGNEMGIAYTNDSRHAEIIASDNWIDLLCEPEVIVGRSDPNSDPCGYRTVLTYRLAEQYYNRSGLADILLHKNMEMIRPKETDLLALLEVGTLDYVPIYRSVAVQHKLRFLPFPQEINLCCENMANLYALESVSLSGKSPGETIVRKGAPISYALTILRNAPNRELAERFVSFMLSPRGRRILEGAGMSSKLSIVPKDVILPESLPFMLPTNPAEAVGGEEN